MEQRETIRVVLAGGGTGGHIYPLAAVSEELKKQIREFNVNIELHYVGEVSPYSVELKQFDVVFHKIVTGKWRRYFSLLNIVDIPKFFIGLIQVLIKLFFIMPDVVFSKGGTGGFPVVIVAWFYRIPIIIHESDVRPGVTNLLSARFAKIAATSFEGALKYFPKKKQLLTGAPIRIGLLSAKQDALAAKEQLGFSSDVPLILFLGGSQGSKMLNEFVEVSLKELMSVGQILHQTGRANFYETDKLTKVALQDVPLADELKARYKAVAFFDIKEMAKALSAADLVVSRAGSGSIFEIAAFGKPAILIPLEGAARDHQRVNASAFSDSGAGIVIEEGNLSGTIFAQEAKRILENPKMLSSMKQASSAFSVAGASERIAQEIISLVGL